MHVLPYWRLSGYYFFYFAFIGAFSPYFGLYLQSLSFSAWDISLLMSLMQLMRLFGPNAWGWMADHWGHRVLIVRCAAVVSLAGFLAFFWLRDFYGMALVMGVLAFFWSAALPLVEGLTFDHLRAERGRYSQIRVWGSIGFVVAVLLTGALLDYFPLLAVLWICLALLAGIVICALVLPDCSRSVTGDGEVSLREILRRPAVQALLVACFAMSAAHGALYVFYSIHLAANGYTKTGVGLLWSLGVVAEILVFMAMPRLNLRFTPRRILLVCFGAAALRFVVIGWWVDSLILAVLAQILHGLTFGAYHAAAISAINDLFPGKAQARGQALYSSLTFGAGGLLGGLVAGWMWDGIGPGWTYTVSSLFALWGGWVIYAGFTVRPKGVKP